MKVVLKAQLRNGMLAEVFRRRDMIEPFDWFGRVLLANGQAITDPRFNPAPHMWRADGCWREDGTEHPLDIEIFGGSA